MTLLLLFCSLLATPGQVDALFQDYDQPGVPGAAVSVIRDGKVLYEKAYGLANLEEKTRATTRTNYRLASCTKQFTAMAIMMLAQRGKLTLDQRLTDFFPGFPPYGSPITVRHLLSHTSGLIAYESVIEKETPPRFSVTHQVKDRDVLEILEQQSATYFPPGSEYRYSNSGYAVLSLIVESVSHVRFAQFLKQNIFSPLRMKDTVAYEQGISVVRNRAYGYTRRDHGFERTDQSATSAVLGDGGIYSSVHDLYQWDQALYGSKLIRLEMLEQAFTPAIVAGGKTSEYGFGWEIGTWHGLRTVSHSGSTLGFRTRIMRIPERKFAVIVLINRNDADPAELANRIADLYHIE